MLCLVTGQNTGNLEMTMTYEDKQIRFTLFENNEITKIFYEKSKAEGEFVLRMVKYEEQLDFQSEGDFSSK